MKKTQSGISLFIVMIIVLLSAILVAMSFRSSFFNEYVVGNTAEYQRVTEAAQALISDAELDIQGIRANGSKCSGNCRVYGSIDESTEKSYFPDQSEYADVLAALDGASNKCIKGICLPQDESTPFWANEATLNAMKGKSASYGEFTGATASDIGNPRLQTNAWYWVELLPYDLSGTFFSSQARNFTPAKANVLYRITAIVEGSKNARSVIQKVIVIKKV